MEKKNGKFCLMWEVFFLSMFILTGAAASTVLKSTDKKAENGSQPQHYQQGSVSSY